MHSFAKHTENKNAPQTKGLILHGGGRYDLFAGLFGMGYNQPNSKMVVDRAGIRPGERVLDVGCGTGSLTCTAKSTTGPDGVVCGIDASSDMISAAQQKALRAGVQVDFRVGLIEQIPFPDASFDVVISRLMLHHLPNDLKRAGLAEVRRVLKPGGRFFAVDFEPPANPTLHSALMILVGHRMMRTNTSELPALLQDAGFVEVKTGPTSSKFLAFVEGKNLA